MKRLFENTNTIVVVGAWNVAVFTPEWIKHNVLEEESKFTAMFPLNVGCSLRFCTDFFTFGIEGNRLVFVAVKDDDIAYIKIVQTLRKIVQKLPHTPVSAMGTNFVYEREKCFDVFSNLNDSQPLTDNIPFETSDVQSTALLRKFKISDKEDLTIRIESAATTNIVDFNFNYALTNASDIFGIIEEDDFILKNMQISKNIVYNVYGE